MSLNKLFSLRILPIALLLALLCMFFPGRTARAATVYIVTVPFSASYCKPPYAPTAPCGLVNAIALANAESSLENPVFIHFSETMRGLSFSGTTPFSLSGNYITLDGEDKNITIGDSDPANLATLTITGNHNTVQNLSFEVEQGDNIHVGDFAGTGGGNYNLLTSLTISGSPSSGIHVHGSSLGGNFNEISYNRIGAVTGNTSCSAEDGNRTAGITIDGGALSTLIRENTIVCNQMGVNLIGPTKNHDTLIENNLIGVDENGNQMGNQEIGIYDGSSTNTTILGNIVTNNLQSGIFLSHGSNAAILDNVISGNSEGIRLWVVAGAEIYGNKIGTNETGIRARPNSGYGIYIIGGSAQTIIGSPTDPAKRNIISGNELDGVRITSNTQNAILDGNYIGLGADGRTIIPNRNTGVFLDGGSNFVLSTASATVSQLISGNLRQGVYAAGTNQLSINLATHIGVKADLITPAGNGLEGIRLEGGSIASTLHPGSVMYNGAAGIGVVDGGSTGNQLIPERIGYNLGLGIDLGVDGPTANGTMPLPGPNNWQPFPTWTGWTPDGFTGSACANCVIYLYKALGDPRDRNGGGIYLSMAAANSSGEFAYTYPSFPVLVAATTMVACDPSGNCSEMSQKIDNPNHHAIYLPFIGR